MQFNPISIVLTLVGGLLLAALLGWIRRPRLTVFVPRTFSYNQLSDKGHLVEVTVFNRGFKTEENVDVTLNPSLKYELLGANSPDASVDKNRLKMTRIAPSDEITMLLIVENGVFKPDDITQTVSKETKGTTVAKLEDVPPTAQQRVGLVGIFIVFPALCYLAYTALDSAFFKPNSSSQAVVSNGEQDARLAGWTVPEIYKRNDNKLYMAFTSGELSLEIGSLSAKGDLVQVPFKIKNDGSMIVKATIHAMTSTVDKRTPSYNQRISDIIVFPGKTIEKTIPVIIPAKSSENERTIFADVFLEDGDGESMQLKKRRVFQEK